MIDATPVLPSHPGGEERRREAKAPWPVDLVHLRRYTMGDRQLETEVLHLFAADLPRSVEVLQSAADDRDWHRAAHTIKGTARTIGAWRLARAAYAAERFGGVPRENETREALLERISAAAGEVIAYIRALDEPLQQA